MKSATLIPTAAFREEGICACHLDGAYQTSGMVYKVTDTINNIGQPKIYTCSTKHTLKTRFLE